MASMSSRWYALRSFSASRLRSERSCARTRAAFAQDAAKGRDPAEPLVGLEHAIAFDAAVDLGTLSELVEEVHLEPAGDAARRHPGVEQLVPTAQQGIDRLRGVALLERTVGQLGEVPGGGRGLERIAELQPGVPDAHLRDHVERPPSGERHGQLGERLEAPADPRRRPADPLGDHPELAGGRGDERQDPVRLAQIEAREDDRLGRVAARDGHPCDGSTSGPDARCEPGRMPASPPNGAPRATGTQRDGAPFDAGARDVAAPASAPGTQLTHVWITGFPAIFRARFRRQAGRCTGQQATCAVHVS